MQRSGCMLPHISSVNVELVEVTNGIRIGISVFGHLISHYIRHMLKEKMNIRISTEVQIRADKTENHL